MKLLALSDLHGHQPLFDAIVRHAGSVDVVVLAGDLLERRRDDISVREGQRECGEILTKTLEPVTCPVLFIMGNDDMVVWRPSVQRFRHIHGQRVELS
ncbi:MAG: metallophosphoesterase family protein, partial [Planctomycetota bacterium]